MSKVAAYAPGRVELLGNHTDYNQGVVLAAAIDRGLTVSGTAREDERIVLTSATLRGRIDVPLGAIRQVESEPWANYPLGVTREMLAAGFTLRGFEAEVSGDLPAGGGLSSSAAFEVATALFLARLFRLHLPPLALAKLCHRAENQFVGVQSGLLDQITCVFGRADHVVFLDCRSEEIRTAQFPPDLALIIANSGVTHRLVAGEYNARRAECAAAAEALGVRSLRDVSVAEVERSGANIDSLLRRRALHIAGENERVLQAVDALAAGDGAEFGRLMSASHESSRVNFENSTPELDLLVQLALDIPGALGARLTGGGFGGSIVMLVRAEHATEALEQISERYKARTGIDPMPFVTKAADGAR